MSAESIIEEIAKLPPKERLVVQSYLLSITEPTVDSPIITKARKQAVQHKGKSREVLFSELNEVLEEINS
jgi:hypothetical protein